MRNFTLLLSGCLFGFAWYVEPNNLVPQTGDASQKGPPVINTVEWAQLNGADRTIANADSGDNVISFMQRGKGSLYELSAFENRTTTHIRSQNQSNICKTYYPDIIIKTNNFNQI